MTVVFCPSDELHQPDRKIVPGGERVGFSEKGLRLGAADAENLPNGLTDLEWRDGVGEDGILEAEVVSGTKWGLGIAVSGNGFQGYRVFFAAIDHYPNGIAIDPIYPGETINPGA